MADNKPATKPATTPKNRVPPPQKVFRWEEGNVVTGKLTAAIVRSEEKFGARTRIALDTATVLLPARYSQPYAQAGVPVGALVTITKSGAGRDTEYELTWD